MGYVVMPIWGAFFGLTYCRITRLVCYGVASEGYSISPHSSKRGCTAG